MQAAFVGVVEAVLAVDLLQVFAENRFMGEHHVAVVAAVGLVPAVQVQVVLQRTLLGEGLPADFTLEGLDARVHAHVPVQVALLREGLPTQEAHEQLVHLQVVGVVLQLAEHPGTLGALVVPLAGGVVAPRMPAVLVSGRGAERESGHAERGPGHLAAAAVHGGVDEGVLRLRGVQGGGGAAGEVPGGGALGRIVDRLHFDYGDVAVSRPLPGTPAQSLKSGLGLKDHVPIIILDIIIITLGAVVVPI